MANRLSSLLNNIVRKNKMDRALQEELEASLELLTQARIEQGLCRKEARRQALIEFGGVEQVKEEVRHVRLGSTIESIGRDFRHALRSLRRNPLFTAAAVLSLAIGIGANTSVLVFLYGYLINPLPFEQGDRLASILASAPQLGRARWGISYPEFMEIRRESRSFGSIAAWTTSEHNLMGGAEPERVLSASVSGNFFEVLGVKPALGRTFVPRDEETAAPAVVILSQGLWQRSFAGEAAVVGRSVVLNGEPHTVIGVLPAKYAFPNHANLWVPARLGPAADRADRKFRLLGRLAADASIERAQLEMNLLAARFAKAYPKENAGVGILVESLRQDLLDESREPLLIVYGIVSLVLLLACANVANLLMARGAARRREIAIRSCLGAGRLRIIGQLLVESLLLALMGGGLGLLIGVWGRDLFLAGIPNEIPAYFSFEIDLGVVAILTGTTLVSSVLFGLAPAVMATHSDSDAVLPGGDDRTTARPGPVRFRSLLVCLEVGLAVLVLIAAGLMIRGFLRLSAMDPGFNAKDILTMEINLSNAGEREAPDRIAFFRQIIERIRQHPGVASVAAANPLPYVGWPVAYELEGPGRSDPQPSLTAMDAVVTPGYFRTLEIPLLKGRDFDERDDAPIGRPVAIVSDTFAQRNWPGEDPIGRRFRLRPAEGSDAPWMEVVGVVGETRARTFSSPNGWIYYPHGQRPFYELILTIRTREDPLRMIAQVKSLVRSEEPDLPLHWNQPLESLIRDRYWEPPVYSWMFAIFSVLALTMALMGVYGVVAYSVAMRSREFGVRLSLGANRKDILVLVLRRTGYLSLCGIIGGLAAAFVVMRIAAGIFYGVSPTDPTVYACCSIVVATAILLAGWLPARRASRIDPAITLRCE